MIFGLGVISIHENVSKERLTISFFPLYASGEDEIYGPKAQQQSNKTEKQKI